MMRLRGVAWVYPMAVALQALSGCTVGVTDGSGRTENHAHVRQTVVSSGGIVYSDTRAGCRWEMPSGDYRVRARHFDTLPRPDKVRHRFTIRRGEGASLARIDVWDNPKGWNARTWVRHRLRYLLDDAATVEDARVGKQGLPGLLLRTASSPQAFAMRTVVVARGKKVVVVTGSNVEHGQRREAFERIVASIDLEVSP